MTNTTSYATLVSYDTKILMAQTRKLAADYRSQTGHAMPVTEELARFDAVRLLGLAKVEGQEGIDAISKIDKVNADGAPLRYLIKGRVIFKGGKARQKLGKLSLNAKWNTLLMVIYNADYLPNHIYQIDRAVIKQALATVASDKRGSMTVAKYKAIGKLIWDSESQTNNKEQGDIEKDI